LALALKSCDLSLDTQEKKLVQFPHSNREAFPAWSPKNRPSIARLFFTEFVHTGICGLFFFFLKTNTYTPITFNGAYTL
ncbi:MAG: hypothetical protein K1563_18010, partial [Candidatus Thiodiazotropha sp. (ex. Lucinisca nassula)]|nr:hypothetical protein [Candidatus Thiodiazotropha sp. (ex. Lucinisca nassula)]